MLRALMTRHAMLLTRIPLMLLACGRAEPVALVDVEVADEAVPAATGSDNPYLQPDESWIHLEGTVAAIQPDSFVPALTVDATGLDYDPFAPKGYQHLHEGDRVRVHGTVDYDLFDGNALIADRIVALRGSQDSES